MQKKILIIEDDIILRELVSKKLSSENFDILTATDGESGFEAAQVKRPDLILLDIILPRMDGFEVLRKLKEDATLSAIPVIMISNLSQKQDIEKSLKLGAVDYIIKALFTSEEVIDKIKKILE